MTLRDLIGSIGHWLRSRSVVSRVLKGGAWSAVGQLIMGFGIVGITALLARLLPPESVGLYLVAFSTAHIVAIVSLGGLEVIALRAAAGSLSGEGIVDLRRKLLTISLVGMGLAAIAAMILYLSFPWLAETLLDSPELSGAKELVAIWAFVAALQQLLGETYRGFDDIRSASVFGGALSMVLTICVFGFVFFLGWDLSLSGALLITLVSVSVSDFLAMGGVVLHLNAADRKGERESVWVRLRALGHWMSEGAPVAVVNVVRLLFTHADIWILAMFRPPAEVAVYGVAAKVVKVVPFSLAVVNGFIPPIIVEYDAKERRAELEKIIRNVTTLAALPAVMAVIALAIFGSVIFEIGFGPQYGGAYGLALVLAIGHLVSVTAGSAGYVLLMTGRQSRLMRLSVFSGLLALWLSVSGAATLGAMGVAIGIATGMGVHQALMVRAVGDEIGIRTYIDPNGMIRRIRAHLA